MNVFIYTLEHPITGEVRYVGKTIDPTQREKDHLSKLSARQYKACWIKSLALLGLKPKFQVLEVIENSNDYDWQEVERFWISYLRFVGCRLTNTESGGCFGKRLSEETKAKMSNAQKGKPKSDSHKLNMRLSRLRNGTTQRQRDSVSLANSIRVYTPEYRKRLSFNRLGRKHSQATIEKMKAAWKRRSDRHVVSIRELLKRKAGK